MSLSYKWLGFVGLLGFVVSVGCSATSGTGTFGNVGGGGAGGEGNSGQGNSGNDGSGGDGGSFIPPTDGGGGGPIDDCSDEAKLVYVLSDANELYSFDPPAKLFTKIGNLNCNTGLSPNSMAVDRNAVAWVNYVDSFDSQGVIFKVSTKDASCDAAPTVQLVSGWARIGMGFSKDADGMGETLFVSGTSGTGIGKINAMNTLNPIAGFSPGAFTGQSAELTGTGDGRLYGYFTTTPVQMGQIDKATGAVTNPKEITGLQTPSAWAFSFWGGSFYLYAASGFQNSNVTKYDPVAGTIDNFYMTNVGFRIVGAGVSTCAPLIEPPPK
ncbi:MAG: hypothetical protein IPM54_41870 [Polyangiaceae bacterium]|nr:hypothetical protein [Polyangiaceae bacterium]